MNDMTEFHAVRQTGLGGSDMAALLGLSKWATPLEIYLSKRGELPPFEDNPLTKAGRIMEQVIAAMTAERLGLKLRRVNRALRHRDYPFLIGHIDRDIVGQTGGGVEIKNVSPQIGWQWGKDGDPAGVPEYYLPQAHHYMLITDAPWWIVSAYFGGADLRTYRIERDPEWDDILIDAGVGFWERHVLPGIPPEPDYYHRSTIPLLRKMYPGTSGEKVVADDMLYCWAQVARQASKESTKYQDIADGAKAHLLHAMGEAAVLQFPQDGTEFRRKSVERAGYTVEPSSYVDARFFTPKKAKE